MAEEVLKELTERVRRINSLLLEPEPGLFTWKERLERQVSELAKWWTEDDPNPLADSHEALVAALRDVFALIDEGHLVRNVANDGDPKWALAALKFVERMARAHAALEAAV